MTNSSKVTSFLGGCWRHCVPLKVWRPMNKNEEQIRKKLFLKIFNSNVCHSNFMQKAIVQSFFNLKNQNFICNYGLRRLITCFMYDCGVLWTDDLFINIAFDCINLTLTFFLTLFCNFVREETILRHQTIRCTTT